MKTENTLGRKSIRHLWQLSDQELEHVKSAIFAIEEKVDGAKVTFGKDKAGNFFMAGGAGVPIFSGDDFVKHTAAKTDDSVRLDRANAYSSFFYSAKDLLDSQMLPGTNRSFEMFIREIAKPVSGGLAFVKSVYPNDFVGKVGTLVRLDRNRIVGNHNIKILDLPSISFYQTFANDAADSINDALAAKTKIARRQILERLERNTADSISKRTKGHGELLAVEPEGFVLSSSNMSFKVTTSFFAKKE